ncbi:pitrilysin family protein [Sphingomonas sp. HITSZ_GF]|uniref:M16 family metallopeptidase n=1 Tax=Sphingomonas sp. HITSZ_GF TaxID=3037247 RepID=UPI00240E594E|nr:pitrilysin family protein [Sphingomonas sp. HITSZ_GF]MDG2533029.1 pitrilysin family protein [Sphingomonas sp. HITSZ_GF]
MRLRYAALSALLLTQSTLSIARAQTTDAVLSRHLINSVRIPYSSFTLPNGLRVVVHTDRKTPVVAVGLWYDVGSRNEPAGKTGFAHLFEHLMFGGSANAPGEYFEQLKAIGATGYNGTTSFDRTNYYETVPTGALERTLFLEADRMGHLLEVVTQQRLDAQRGVVQNEKRQGLNRPYGLVDSVQIANLFPQGHPYGHTILGSMDDLNAASLADVHQWFREHYGPNDVVLSLAGDIDLPTAKRLVTKYFGSIPSSPKKAALQVAVPTLDKQVRKTIHDAVPATRLYRSWVVPGRNDKDAISLSIGAWVLGGLTSSRLDTILVRDEQLAVRVTATLRRNIGISTFEVSVDVKPGIDPDRVEQRLDALLADYFRTGPTEAEISRVASRLISGQILPLESNGMKAALLAEGLLYSNDPERYRKDWTAYAEARPDQVRAAMAKWLLRPGLSLTVAPGTREPEATATSSTPAATTASPTPPAAAPQAAALPMPPIGTTPSLRFPQVSRSRLSNGIEVIYANRSAVPVTLVELSFDAGYAADSRARPGTAEMATSLIADSTKALGPTALAQRAEELGALIYSGSSTDSSGVVLTALSDRLEPSLDLMAEVTLDPVFAPTSIERKRGQMLAQIASQSTTPSAIASRYLLPAIYGADHPYGLSGNGSGTRESVSAISREDLTAFQRSWIRADKAKIFVVSDRPLSQIQAMLEARFGKWRASGTGGSKSLDLPAPSPTPRIVLIDRKGAPQSLIAAGELLPVRGGDDTLNLETANDVLGGSFLSRINMDLRQKKGWTYGASTRISTRVGQANFQINASVQSDKTGASIAALRQDIDAFLGADGITDRELRLTADGAVRQLPGRFETASSVLYAMEENDMLRRPDDYYSRLATRYAAQTGSALDQAARKAIDPEKLLWVVVGDAETVRPQLDGLGLPIEVVTALQTGDAASPKKNVTGIPN